MELSEGTSVDITLYQIVNVLVDRDQGGISYLCLGDVSCTGYLAFVLPMEVARAPTTLTYVHASPFRGLGS